MTDTASRVDSDVLAELHTWLTENWDPEITVAQWWDRLGTSGWAAPTWPVESFGKGLNRAEGVAAQKAIADFGALGAPGGLGLLLAGPTIVDHGDDDQKARFLKDIVTGQKAWCQLFSEPGAGSDLAGLQARAMKDGEEWIVNGQKVWTSGGQVADLGMLIARTDFDLPKHQGITYFGIEMNQPGMDVRPLREMTGRAMFNEVFMTDVRVADRDCIGGLNNGWRVANSTLMHERAGLGAGGGSAGGGSAVPGTIAGDLPKRVGDFVSDGAPSRGGAATARSGATGMIKLAQANGKNKDKSIRQELAKLHTINELGRMNQLRAKAAFAVGKQIPGLPNIGKLSMSEIVRMNREIGTRILGPYATLHAYDAKSKAALDEATGNPMLGAVTESAIFSPGPSIYGGTDQVQRNIIGERVLGLPKEPNNDKVMPFKELPKNG
jgi:alkylation response protein AidB-like acyl-CoA dehydrogenase